MQVINNTNPNIIILQECTLRFYNFLHDQDVLDLDQYNYTVYSDLSGEHENMILSKYLIKSSNMFQFKKDNELDRKSFTIVNLQINSQIITLNNVHLKAGISPKNTAIRQDKINQLLNFNNPHIVVGDFNFSNKDDEDILLLKQHYIDADPNNNITYYWRKEIGSFRYDRLYYKIDNIDNIYVNVINKHNNISDHFGLLVNIYLN